MKILVTSGGTKIPIDRVRSITNMSKGTFGTKIAVELLQMGHQVIFLRAEGSRSPFTCTVDFYNGGELRDAEEVYDFCNSHFENYSEFTYKTFDDYAKSLQHILRDSPDVTILAAAVSDYGVVNMVDGKIRSKGDLTIELKPLSKLIGQVKEWCPTTHLVGFKLLVDSTEAELIEAARDSLMKNHCDIVVANDLRDIKKGQHQIIVVSPSGNQKYKTKLDDPNYLARKVAEEAVKTAIRGD